MRSAILLSAFIIARTIDNQATSEMFWTIMIILIAFVIWDIIEFLLDHLEIRSQGRIEY